MSAAFAVADAPPSRRALLPLLREIGDLKRVTAAGRTGSIAGRLFRSAWAEVAAGAPLDEVALATTARALAATRLADLDVPCLLQLGLSRDEAERVQDEALAGFRGLLDAGLLSELRSSIHHGRHPEEAAKQPSRRTHGGESALRSASGPGPDAPQHDALSGSSEADQAPPFVQALAHQPRAGVTCPGRARIVLQPAENHAEHCLVVAVYAVLLAEPGTDLGAAFLAALAHHLHNAGMPDAGFTGETLLGSHLEPVMARATDAALAQLPPPVREATVAARAVLPDTSTAEGRAFHSADVIDRVLEIEQHLAAAQLTMDTVLGDMALVHDGPVKPFHDAVLREMGLG